MQTWTIQVEGMMCAHCQAAVEEAAKALPGVQEATVDLTAGTVTVTAVDSVQRADICAAVEEQGYDVV